MQSIDDDGAFSAAARRHAWHRDAAVSRLKAATGGVALAAAALGGLFYTAVAHALPGRSVKLGQTLRAASNVNVAESTVAPLRAPAQAPGSATTTTPVVTAPASTAPVDAPAPSAPVSTASPANAPTATVVPTTQPPTAMAPTTAATTSPTPAVPATSTAPVVTAPPTTLAPVISGGS